MFSISNLNSDNSGSTHIFLFFGVVVLSAIIGVYTLVSGSADSKNNTDNSTLIQSLNLIDDLKGYNSPEVDKYLADRQNQLPADLKPESENTETAAKLNQKPRKTSLVIKRSQKIAEDYWHDVAAPGLSLCSSSNRGRKVMIRYSKMGGNKIAYTYHKGDSKNDRPDCTIWVNKYLKGRIPGGYADNLCEAIVHEYGHLYGYSHSHHPGYIMNEHVSGNKLKRCNLV